MPIVDNNEGPKIKGLNNQTKNMQYFKLKNIDNNYNNFKIVKGKNALEVIKKYDLTSRKNDCIIMQQLEGEQLAIAISNEQ